MVIYGFVITLISYLIAKPLNKKIPQIPLIVFAMFIVIGLLAILGIPYEQYMNNVNGVFNHLLGYVTVALAIPLAAMRYDDLPIKSMIGILCFASISAVALPMRQSHNKQMIKDTIHIIHVLFIRNTQNCE
jgi:putative effector of murein hydrolase